ncbi:MAG: TVP38/TMEM64 family protein [Pirellulales bacterium]|nr:TVP38/TMEM64 family protein [Pirellulales bacterium]
MGDTAFLPAPNDVEGQTAVVGGGGPVRLTALVAIVLGLATVFTFFPVNGLIGQFLGYVQSLGVWGPVLLALAYVVATVLMVPGLILTLGAGFAFGLVQGMIAVSVGSVLGAIAAFLLGRTLGRDYVEHKASEFPAFAAIDRAVQRSGFKIVLLTRLSPAFPFNVLNYLFSITGVRTRDYFLASWIGMFPGTLMYIYFGTAIKTVADLVGGQFEGGTAQKVLLLVGLIATVIVTVYVTRIARAAIRECVPAEDAI